MNGGAVPRSRDSSVSGSKYGADQNYLLPSRVDALGHNEQSLSRTHSEAESLLDLYGRDSTNRSISSAVDVADRLHDMRMHPDDYTDAEHANWIHRDKLAKIESEELQQLGINIPRSTITSRSASLRGRSQDFHGTLPNGVTEGNEQWPATLHEKVERLASRLQDETLVEQEDEEFVMCDPRLPEEIAEDSDGYGPDGIYRMPGLRKSSSRIPVFATSQHPVPQEHLERELPLPRTRNNTVTSGDDGLSYPKSRRPSQSAPRALESPESEVRSELKPESVQQEGSRPGSRNTQTAQPSPTKSKTPKATNTPRKTSAPPNNRKTSGGSKAKSPSNSNNSTPNQRPVTRSSENRPTTAVNRPEGDPPWLATMYKPDPRLPQDQQVIPTHAKKMQQEMWEREGKVPSTYDRDFAPLAIQPDRMRLPPLNTQLKPADSTAPVLGVPSPIRSPDSASRPGTSGTDHGGYKTMPNVSPKVGPGSNVAITPKPKPQPLAVEDPPVKEKGCGCCIVM